MTTERDIARSKLISSYGGSEHSLAERVLNGKVDGEDLKLAVEILHPVVIIGAAYRGLAKALTGK